MMPRRSGQVLVDGLAVTTGLYRRARAGLSYVPEERGLIRALSVEDNRLDPSRYDDSDRLRRQAFHGRGLSLCTDSPSWKCGASSSARC
jgi:ABC-type lipopolysaccharide export system ATPase subunit